MENNVILFTNEFETSVVYNAETGKFRYYIDNPFTKVEGGRATILPTTSKINKVGGIEHVTMQYGYGIVTKQDDTGSYYEFERVETDLLTNYFKHTDKRYVDESNQPVGSAVGFRYQYESNFLK
jgi:hypothetical protein